MYNPGVQYVPPPVRSMASTSGAPTWLETMTYTVFEVAGIPLRVHGAPSGCALPVRATPP